MAENISDRTDGQALSPVTNLNSPAVTLVGSSVSTAKKKSAEIKRQLPRTVASAKQRITRLLHNPDRRGEFRNRRKGKLDRGRLARLSTGNDNVFTQPWQRQGYKTAVSLILDNSVSMSGSNNRTAVKLGYVFGDALAAANINFSVAAFPDVSISRNRKSERENNNLTGGDRVRGSDYWGAVAGVCDTDVSPKPDNPKWREIINEQHLNDNRHAGADTLKPFGVPWSKADFNLSLMWERTTGNTPLVKALLQQMQQMRFMPEKKKVIFVMSDGGADEGMACLKDAVKLANLWGIKVVGLGIGSPTNDWVQAYANACNAAVTGETCEDILLNLDKLADELE